MARHAPWLYFKTYVAGGFAGMEHLIGEMLPALFAVGGYDRWFFLRFCDEGGLHLRLRLRATGGVESLAAAVEPLVAAGLARTIDAPAGGYRPAIRPSALTGRPLWGPDRKDVALVRAEYAPEVDKFGVAGMEVAERLFEVSSRLAVEIVVDDRAGRCSRKSLVPALMRAVRRGFGGLDGADPFWSDYASYWLDRIEAPRSAWLGRFAGQAEALARRGVRLFSAALPAASLARLDAWAEAVDASARAFAALGQGSRERRRDLAFHFIHLMNNRLGLLPIEEAYFAALVGHAEARSAA